MKKLKLSLILIITYAAAHFSFTSKVIGGGYLVFKANEVKAQPAFFPTANCHANNYEINKWMSPSNDCGNRFVASKISPDSFTVSQHQIIWDSLAKTTSTLNTNTVTLAVVLNFIPLNAIVRMNQSLTGTTTITFLRGQETY